MDGAGGSQDADKLRKQVSTLADFGVRALRSNEIGELLQQATKSFPTR